MLPYIVQSSSIPEGFASHRPPPAQGNLSVTDSEVYWPRESELSAHMAMLLRAAFVHEQNKILPNPLNRGF